jgi:hypothetical protein
MKWIHKIVALFLLPVMLISFTGAEFHFHICGHTGKFYTDIHFTDSHHSHELQSCCEIEETENCCPGTCSVENEYHASCCIDLKKEIKTDENYNFSNHTFKSEIHGHALAEFYTSAEPKLPFSNRNFTEHNPVYLSPPHSSKVQLLL